MASKLTNRVQKLEENTNTGEYRSVIPPCCYYEDGNKECGCFMHWTKTPFVLLGGLDEFYKKIKQPCEPMPKDALADAEYGAMVKDGAL